MWQVCSATGWSVDYVLWGVNYATLILMLSDAPRYTTSPRTAASAGKSAEEQAADIAGFFQSKT